jgi:hypothetical protein
MSDSRCPNCGAEVPAESGQHSLSPSAGIVACPSCGATLSLGGPGDRQHVGPEGETPTAAAAPPGQPGQDEYFSGHESVDGVMEEISEKEDGARE